MLEKIKGALSARTAPVYTLVMEHPMPRGEEGQAPPERFLEDAVQAQVVLAHHIVAHLGQKPRRLCGTVDKDLQQDGLHQLVGARCILRLTDDEAAMSFAEAVREHACEGTRVRVLPGDVIMERRP